MSMKKPFYYRYHPPHSVLAKRAPSGGWEIDGKEHLDSMMFKEMYTDEPPIPYRIFPTGEPFGIDVKKAIEDGLYSVQLITSKDEIELFHQEHPDSWFLDGSLCQAIRYQSFPLCWVGWVKPGEPITTEANAQYGLPLFGLISMRD